MEAYSGEKNVEVVLKDSSILLDTSKLFNNEELSDVKLVVGDNKFYSHRFVLAKSSSVFKTMLYGKHWSESVGEEVTLKETPECEAVFDLFIKHLYTAEVAINLQTVVSILCLADKYDVESLKDLCLSYMEKKSHVAEMETVVSWYTWAKTVQLSTLASICLQAIMLNTRSLLKSTMWVDLDIDFLKEILSSSELVIDQEYDLFVGLSQWLLEESHVPSLKENSERLLPLIRYSQIQAIDLRKVEESELAIHKESSGILHELLGGTFRLRALNLSCDRSDFSDSFYTPRDYLTRKAFEWKTRTDNGRLYICGDGDSVTGQSTFPFSFKPCVNKCNVKVDFGPGASGGENEQWDIFLAGTENLVLTLRLCVKDYLGKAFPIQVILLVTDMKNRVMQSERTPIKMCETGSEIKVSATISYPDKASNVIVLMKPMPNNN